MKISNETKVGALTVLALALLFIGFNYLKGRDVFSNSKKIYAVFTDLGSLEKSNEVKINGLPVGMQLIGPYFSEHRLLNATHQFQKVTDWHRRSPAAFA